MREDPYFQGSFPGVSLHQSTANYSNVRQAPIVPDFSTSPETNSGHNLSEHYTNSRIHQSNPISSTPLELTAAQTFNPTLTAVPPSGLPSWPGASIPRSRAKQKHPRLSRTHSADYLLGAGIPSDSQTSYSHPNPRPSYLTTSTAHALTSPHNSSPRHLVSIAGNFPAQNLNQFCTSDYTQPKGERHFATNSTTAQLYSFNNMYHADGDLDTLEEYEEDDIMAGLQEGSPSAYLPHGDYMSGASGGAEGGGKKDEKQVRRRSSKGKFCRTDKFCIVPVLCREREPPLTTIAPVLSSTACDQCRKSKCKCERTSDGEPCRSCILLGTRK